MVLIDFHRKKKSKVGRKWNYKTTSKNSMVSLKQLRLKKCKFLVDFLKIVFIFRVLDYQI